MTTTGTLVPHPSADLARLHSAFAPVRGYLNAATVGLPPVAVVEALTAGIADWQHGRADAGVYDEAVRRSRSAYARLVGIDESRVAVGSQTSVLVGMVAAALPDGAEVLAVEGDFTSVTFPFLVHADRGVHVRHVPLAELAAEVRPSTAMVAFSLAQSCDGAVVDAEAVRAAAAAVGALTLCDTTQAAGWMPVDATAFDLTVCSAYKWLCAPRGVAFLTITPATCDAMRPLHAGWYAGESVWASMYGPEMTLARDARRFDVSPAWLCWVGAAEALELFAAADLEAVRRHDVALADRFLAGLGLAPRGSAIVSIPDPTGTVGPRLAAADIRVAARAGAVRAAFHVWNDGGDVDLALDAISGTPRRRC